MSVELDGAGLGHSTASAAVERTLGQGGVAARIDGPSGGGLNNGTGGAIAGRQDDQGGHSTPGSAGQGGAHAAGVVQAVPGVRVGPLNANDILRLAEISSSDFSPRDSPSLADLQTLVKAGYTTVEDVLKMDNSRLPITLLQGFNADKCSALFVLANMHQVKRHSFKSGKYFCEDSDSKIRYIQTGSTKLNALLGGRGISTGAVTMIFGESCSYGRSSLCHTLATICQFGGVDGAGAAVGQAGDGQVGA